MQCQKLRTYMETGRVIFLPERSIHPNPEQPRKTFSQEQMNRLADSIRQHGILQPLTVRRSGAGYELIAGERRLRAARAAGLTEIPCIILQMDGTESAVAAMVENLQREDLSYLEEAAGIARLMELGGLRQEEAAKLLGKSQSAVANKLRLLRHGPRVLEALRKTNLSERHARALLVLNTEEEKLSAMEEMVRQKMTVAKAERYLSRLHRAAEIPKKRNDVGAFLNSLSASLSRIQQSGVCAVSERRETEREIVLTITIPK